ncbi:MAG TPA: tetratricopeptide repeat protein [Ramlibacter sp.]|jgi:Flp pilus assembly protein TadD|nr:tetratricopeptide repeat protein [Ramlibacter sp.]
MNRGRLAILQGFLSEDRDNAALLADTCDEAIAAGEHAAADRLLAHSLVLALDDVAWTARRVRLALARHAWDEALARLQQLRQRSGEHPALAHDVAYVHFRRGAFAECQQAIEPWLVPDALALQDEAVRTALQVLWLRAAHHQGALVPARDRASSWSEHACLSPAAAGVAALVALDLADFAAAKILADTALRAGALTTEALVARACAALAEGETAAAQAWLGQALQLHPDDGRTWSALGMASLQARDPAAARTQFARATHVMPTHIGTWHGLGWSCLLLQDRVGALAAFEQALALDRTFSESQAAVGLVLMMSGRADEAEHHLARAERLGGGNVTGRYARALQSGQLKDADAVRELAERLLQRRLDL